MSICFSAEKSLKRKKRKKNKIFNKMKNVRFSIPNIKKQDFSLVKNILKVGG